MSFGRAGSDEQVTSLIARHPNPDEASGPQNSLSRLKYEQ